MLFPERIEAAGGHVAQIERGRPETPHRARAAEECAKQLDEIVGALTHVVRETGDDHRVDQPAGDRDGQPVPIQASALVSLGGEQLAPRRIVDGTHLRAAVDLESERRAEDRQPMCVVGGAVEGIEDPAPPRRLVQRRFLAQLLRQDIMIRKTLCDHPAAHTLALEVHLGDEIGLSLLRHAEAGLTSFELNRSGTRDDINGCREKNGIRQLRNRSN